MLEAGPALSLPFEDCEKSEDDRRHGLDGGVDQLAFSTRDEGDQTRVDAREGVRRETYLSRAQHVRSLRGSQGLPECYASSVRLHGRKQDDNQLPFSSSPSPVLERDASKERRRERTCSLSLNLASNAPKDSLGRYMARDLASHLQTPRP